MGPRQKDRKDQYLRERGKINRTRQTKKGKLPDHVYVLILPSHAGDFLNAVLKEHPAIKTIPMMRW